MHVKITEWNLSNRSCRQCSTPLTFEEMEFNHKVPVQDGGGAEQKNCEGLCHKCHMSPKNYARNHPSAPPVYLFLIKDKRKRKKAWWRYGKSKNK